LVGVVLVLFVLVAARIGFLEWRGKGFVLRGWRVLRDV
jgi:hypothetical protein